MVLRGNMEEWQTEGPQTKYDQGPQVSVMSLVTLSLLDTLIVVLT